MPVYIGNLPYGVNDLTSGKGHNYIQSTLSTGMLASVCVCTFEWKIFVE